MSHLFDVVVLGLGANGSSALYHLSKNGSNICGIDRFSPPHTYGSSHGESRIIRQAYHEHPMYVPLVKEAYRLWHQLESAYQQTLFIKTGGLLLGSETSRITKGAKWSADLHHIPYECLSATDIRQSFPVFATGEKTVGLLEKEAGILFPEKCIEANLKLSAHNGAEIKLTEKVLRIDSNLDSITLHTDKNSYKTKKLIVCAGAWLREFFPELKLPLKVERQVLYWFKNSNQSANLSLTLRAMPVFIWEYDKEKFWYGIPDIGSGIKVALHHAGRAIEPDLLSQKIENEELIEMSRTVSKYISVPLQFSHASVCMYTNTPDEHFIIDRHPQNPDIIIGSPCSGHGFKFSSLTGKILCDMAMENETGFDLSLFRVDRFVEAS